MQARDEQAADSGVNMTKACGSDNVKRTARLRTSQRTSDMILPLHEQVRARVRDALAQLHGITDADLVDSDRISAQPHARRSRHAGRVRPGAPPAQGAARDRAGARRPRSARFPASRASTPRRTATSTSFSIGRRSCSRGSASPARCRRRRRAPRRPSSSTPRSIPNKAAHIGHLRNSALGDTLVRVLQVPRQPGRGAELHRRHRRAGRGRRRRLPRAREARPRRREAHRRDDALRLLLLGPLRARHRVVRGRQGAPEDPRRDAARHRARRRSDRRASPRSSPTPWCART